MRRPTPEYSTRSIKYVDNDLQLSKYLKVEDFIKSETAERNKINNRLPENLLPNAKKIAEMYDRIYERFNGNIVLNSAYRCPALNTKVKGSSTSQHVFALAIDVRGKNGVKNADILNWVRTNMQYQQLIWEYGTSKEPRWVHIGYGTRMQFLKIGVSSARGLGLHLTDLGDI
jgi:zinc D-Ala-D-Ala carboxypeptidase